MSGRRVHVVDDDPAVRDALRALLNSVGLDVHTYATAVDFLDRIPEAKPGCVLTDVRMPGMSGLELLRRLHDRRDQFRVILLTGQADVPMAVEALKNGALDFIEKPFDADRIISAVDSALQQLLRQTERDRGQSAYAERLAELTPREREVLEHLVLGRSSKEIGRALSISPRTVDVYRANIMNKTRADNLAQLVRMVMLVSGPED